MQETSFAKLHALLGCLHTQSAFAAPFEDHIEALRVIDEVTIDAIERPGELEVLIRGTEDWVRPERGSEAIGTGHINLVTGRDQTEIALDGEFFYVSQVKLLYSRSSG